MRDPRSATSPDPPPSTNPSSILVVDDGSPGVLGDNDQSLREAEQSERIKILARDQDCRTVGRSYAKVLTSVGAHAGFILCLVVVVWSRHGARTNGSSDKETNHLYHYYLIASSIAGFLYIVMLVEAAACDTYDYIRFFSSAQLLDDYVTRVREATPILRLSAECYHHEIRTQTRLQRDSKGQVNVRQLRHKEKIITHRESEEFQFSSWMDFSKVSEPPRNAAVVRVECAKVFLFEGERTKESYGRQYRKFRDRNRRWDEFVEHNEEFVMQGYQERLTACVHEHARPCWMSEVWFWLCTMVFLTWPYRWLFSAMTPKMYVIVIKQLSA